jgi:hypothetical protein
MATDVEEMVASGIRPITIVFIGVISSVFILWGASS